MKKKDFTDNLSDLIIQLMAEEKASDTTKPVYARMKYPRLFPLMKFNTKRYRLNGFGSVMIMQTNAMFGLMKLMTASFTPNEGSDLPFLLIDCMAMKKKNLAYVEYYDCTGKRLVFDSLHKISKEFENVPDYAEKQAWYVKERMDGSMIKGGEGVDGQILYELVAKSLREYMLLAKTASKDATNIDGLIKFQNRMIMDGNPSEGTMTKVLGKTGQESFFRTYVMPIKEE